MDRRLIGKLNYRHQGLMIAVVLIAFLPLFYFGLAGVSAQSGNAIENGTFTSGRVGWGVSADSGNCAYKSGDGHNDLGLFRVGTPSCRIMSNDFNPISGAVVTFWAKNSDSGNQNRPLWSNVKCASNGVSYTQSQNPPLNTWTQYTVTVGAMGTHCFVEFYPTDWGYFDIDDVSTTLAGASPVGDYQGNNGGFHDSGWGWVGGNGTTQSWTVSQGHNNSGAYKLWSMDTFSRMFYSNESSGWSSWATGHPDAQTNGTYTISVVDYDGGAGWTELLNVNRTYTNTTTWTSNSFAMTSFPSSHRLRMKVSGYPVVVDDICPSGGCTLGTPTVTPSPTSTPTHTPTPMPTSSPIPTWVGGGNFPYGIGTPVPVDWQNFPTAQPYPTSMYGPGTPQPVIMFGGSPIPIQGGNTTPVLITGTVRIDDRTPVAVRIAPDPGYTPLPYSSVNIQQNSPSSAGVLPTLITHPSNSTIQIGQAGSSENPIRFVMSQADLTTPSISFPPLGVSFSIVVHYVYPTEFVIAGIDILAGLYGLGAAFVITFIFRQIQEK